MLKGVVALIAGLALFNLAAATLGFAMVHDRFPRGIGELLGWLFN
jgi:hypothetical protein